MYHSDFEGELQRPKFPFRVFPPLFGLTTAILFATKFADDWRFLTDSWVLAVIFFLSLAAVIFRAAQDFRSFRAALSKQGTILRIDADGWSMNGELVVPWDQLRSIELRRAKRRLIGSYVNYSTQDGGRTSAVLTFGALPTEQAERCLSAIKHYVPDADAPWQDQLARRGSR